MQNDLLVALDKDGGSILMLLDLSAAFDTIDHTILLRRLYALGIRGPALAWFKSYLGGRMQSVNIQGVKSNFRDLPYGVPQGSVLGPILFTLYTLPLGDIARKFGLQVHIYADDTQLYVSFKPLNPDSLAMNIKNIQNCYSEIKSWMTDNLLKLNGDKTELLISLNKNLRESITINNISLDTVLIEPSVSIRNLGAYFNVPLDHTDFINQKCKSARYALHNISRVRTSLTRDACETLVQAYVTSRLDYCNSLLYGVPTYLLNRLQKVQNSAAKVITMTSKREHVRPVLAALHWLPVEQRVEFKLLLNTWKALNDQAPTYIKELLTPHEARRSLRSADKKLLDPPSSRAKYTQYGDRAFQYSAPYLWNKLPLEARVETDIAVFKSKLKTFLFRKAYF